MYIDSKMHQVLTKFQNSVILTIFNFFKQNYDVTHFQDMYNHYIKFENDPMNSLWDTAWTKLRTDRQTDRQKDRRTDTLIPISLRYTGDNNRWNTYEYCCQFYIYNIQITLWAYHHLLWAMFGHPVLFQKYLKLENIERFCLLIPFNSIRVYTCTM